MEVKEECVVKFQTQNRKITMYFTEDEKGLNMQMAMDPEDHRVRRPFGRGFGRFGLA